MGLLGSDLSLDAAASRRYSPLPLKPAGPRPRAGAAMRTGLPRFVLLGGLAAAGCNVKPLAQPNPPAGG